MRHEDDPQLHSRMKSFESSLFHSSAAVRRRCEMSETLKIRWSSWTSNILYLSKIRWFGRIRQLLMIANILQFTAATIWRYVKRRSNSNKQDESLRNKNHHVFKNFCCRYCFRNLKERYRKKKTHTHTQSHIHEEHRTFTIKQNCPTLDETLSFAICELEKFWTRNTERSEKS